MTAIAYSAALQDRIAYRLWGDSYSNITAKQKAALDGTWTVGDPGGFALDALTAIRQTGQYFAAVVPNSVPSEAEPWLVARTVMLMGGTQARPDRAAEYRSQNETAESAFVDAYARQLITYDPTVTTPEASTLTVLNIRNYVIYHCCRKQRWETVEGTKQVRPRMLVDPIMIDAQIERVLQNLWGRADWSFKRRQVTITIATDSSVTMDLTGETFHSIASREFFYSDTAATGFYRLKWARDGTSMAQIRAYKAATTATGRPSFFRIDNKSGTLTWTFDTTPDQTYTATGEVYVKGPTLTSLAATTTAMARFPDQFAHVIKDLVLAEVLDHLGDPDGKRFREGRLEDEITRLLPTFSSVGHVQDDQGVRDVYGDISLIRNANMYYGSWWGGNNTGDLGGGL